jgi:hypothetical protein
MIVVDLNNNQSTLHPKAGIRPVRSSLHLQAREILYAKYPTISICEEVTISLRKGETAYLDFFIPMLKIAVEVNGEQHFTFVKHFHNTKAEFAKAKKRDCDKREWCRINGIQLIELNYNEINKWKDIV